MIENAAAEDRAWIVALFDRNKSILGNVSGGTVFWRWQTAHNVRERWIVIRPHAFAHYRIRQDGVKVLYEIAVSEEAKRQGYGKQLMAAIGLPCELKTDADSVESNSFYLALGFAPVGCKKSPGGKLLNLYRKG